MAGGKRRFTWDPRKAESNLRKHKISFELARLVFDDPLHESEVDVEGHEEVRYKTTGEIGGTVVVVIHLDEEDEVVRIISARKAKPVERRRFRSG